MKKMILDKINENCRMERGKNTSFSITITNHFHKIVNVLYIYKEGNEV